MAYPCQWAACGESFHPAASIPNPCIRKLMEGVDALSPEQHHLFPSRIVGHCVKRSRRWAGGGELLCPCGNCTCFGSLDGSKRVEKENFISFGILVPCVLSRIV